MVLVDTDVMVDVLRSYLPAVKWLRDSGENRIAVPGFVAVELVQGCRDKATQRRTEELLQPHRVIWPSREVCAGCHARAPALSLGERTPCRGPARSFGSRR